MTRVTRLPKTLSFGTGAKKYAPTGYFGIQWDASIQKISGWANFFALQGA